MQRDYAAIRNVLIITFLLNLLATAAKLGVGIWTGALSLVADGLARFRDAGATLNEAYYLGLYADVEVHAGHADHALELLDEALDRMSSSTRSYFFESELHRLRARGLVEASGGSVEDARDALDISKEIAERQGSPALGLRTATDRLQLEIAHGDPTSWRFVVNEFLEIYAGQAPTPDVTRAQELVSA